MCQGLYERPGIEKGVSHVVLRVDVLVARICGGCSGSVRNRCGRDADFLGVIRGWNRAADLSHGEGAYASSDLAAAETHFGTAENRGPARLGHEPFCRIARARKARPVEQARHPIEACACSDARGSPN